MRKLPGLLIASALLLFVISNLLPVSPIQAAEEEAKVESVEVQLSIAGQIYEGLQERMEFSIGRVGDKILLTQPLALLESRKDAVRNAIFNVFSKVLTGFKVESVDLFLDTHTKVVIHLTPLPPLISEVKVNLEVANVNPAFQNFLQVVSSRVEDELNHIFVGLPVAAVTWSDSIINSVANYILEREFPGFSCAFFLEPNSTTVFRLKITPREPLVSDVMVNFESADLPIWLVTQQAKQYESQFEVLKGLPVDFLIHYQPGLEKYVTQLMHGFPGLQALGLSVNLSFDPGVKTKVDMAIVSPHYHAKLEARYFAGENDHFGNLQGYFGYRTSGYELYTRGYWGRNPGGQLLLGFALPMEKNLTGGFEYETQHQYKNLCFHFQFERGDYLNLRLGIAGSPNEATIGIPINDYVNLEFANYQDNFGVQLMFHF